MCFFKPKLSWTSVEARGRRVVRNVARDNCRDCRDWEQNSMAEGQGTPRRQ